MTKHTIETGATVVMALAAVGMLGLYATRLSPKREQPTGPPRPDTAVVISEDATVGGIRVGPADAELVLVEFNDFECPFCARFASDVVAPLLAVGNAALVVQHYPLGNHRFAVPAAIASECADRQGRFPEMYHQLFANRQLLGVSEWRDIAKAAGVPDLEAFDHCRKLPADSFPRIAAGKALGARIGVRGTPAVVLDGKLLPRAPSLSDLQGVK